MARSPQGATRPHEPSQADRERTIEGEVIESTERALARSDNQDLDASLAVALSEAEINQQIATARRFPRIKQKCVDDVIEMATFDIPTATSCIYSLPRGRDPETGKPKAIVGPSIRLAELIAQSWGNNRVAGRVVAVDRREKFVEAEGIYHDLETNYAVAARVRRRISDKRGGLFSEDMIIVTGNAAASIALRNAILRGIPKPIWGRAYEAVEKVVAGDTKSIGARRVELLTRFRDEMGVKPAQLFQILGVTGELDIGRDELIVAGGFFSALRNNEVTVEDLIRQTGALEPGVGHRTLGGAYAEQKAPPASAPQAAETAAPAQGSPQPQESRPEPTDGQGEAIPPHDPQTGEVVDVEQATEAIAGPAPAGERYGIGSDEGLDDGFVVYVDGSPIGKLSAELWSEQGLPVYEEHAPRPSPAPAPTAARGRRSPASAAPASADSPAPADSGPTPPAEASSAGVTISPEGPTEAPEPDEVTAGVAGPNEDYFFVTDPWGKFGERSYYRDGLHVGTAGRLKYDDGEMFIYAQHAPKPAKAAPKPEGEQGPGETSKSPPSSDASPDHPSSGLAEAVDAFHTKARAATSWAGLRQALRTLERIPEFEALPADLKQPEYVFTYKLGEAIGDVKIAEEPSFYLVWLETEPSRAEIDTVWPLLARSANYRVLKENQRDTVAGATAKAKGEDV